MPRFPKARWRGPVPNETPGRMVRPILGLVLHVEQGSESGSDSWFHNTGAQASAHFGNPLTGPLDQWVDTNDKAWAEAAGNSRWISVEHEGYADKPPAPTPSQIENDAQLLAWLHLTEGVPLRVTDTVEMAGLGWHGMGGQAWGGHLQCPGERIKNARTQIITRAQEIVKPAPTPSTPGWYTRVLSVQAPMLHGSDVRVVQSKVGSRPVDGSYGPHTKADVAAWQRKHDLTADGVVGPVTARALGT